MRRKDYKLLVIDADIAQAAGEPRPHPDREDPRPARCRQFLKAVREICHHVVFTSAIGDEWREHRSQFFAEWRTSMDARKKVAYISGPENEELREKILSTAATDKQHDALEKDIHLIEAAVAADQTIMSLDEAARTLFHEASRTVGELRSIAWVNPEASEQDQVTAWLEAGAESENELTLGYEQG